MESKGLAARLRRSFSISCALTGAWNGRSVNCPGLLLGPACTPLLALARLFALSANCLASALACYVKPSFWRMVVVATEASSILETAFACEALFGVPARVHSDRCASDSGCRRVHPSIVICGSQSLVQDEGKTKIHNGFDECNTFQTWVEWVSLNCEV